MPKTVSKFIRTANMVVYWGNSNDTVSARLKQRSRAGSEPKLEVNKARSRSQWSFLWFIIVKIMHFWAKFI